MVAVLVEVLFACVVNDFNGVVVVIVVAFFEDDLVCGTINLGLFNGGTNLGATAAA